MNFLTVYALVIIAAGAADGGRAIDSSLRFADEAACLAAAQQVTDAARNSNFKPQVSCVEVIR
jgi:hypothetical protein